MTNTIFFDKSYIVASIISFKIKYLKDEFVSIKELNYISDQIQKKLNELNYNAIILNNINADYFEVSDVIKINKLKDLSFESIINYYQGYLNLEILSIIWNEKLIFNYLSEFLSIEKEEMIKKFTINNLEKEKSLSLKKQKNTGTT